MGKPGEGMYEGMDEPTLSELIHDLSHALTNIRFQENAQKIAHLEKEKAWEVIDKTLPKVILEAKRLEAGNG